MQGKYVLCFVLLAAFGHRTGATSACSRPFAFLRDSRNCSAWYRCLFGSRVKMPPCATKTVFSLSVLTCVPRGSRYDDCTHGGAGAITTRPPTVQERCEGGATVFPHPGRCAQFYNCSLPVLSPRPGYLGHHVAECPYPKLFSGRTHRCEPFEEVTCGDRHEPKYACEYVRNQCPVAHCRPCSVDYPNCVGKADGNQVWESRAWSNVYAICYKERSLGHGTCESGKLFSNFTNQCESIFLIPREFGGYRPSCEARADGYYPDEQNRCPYYFLCVGGDVVKFGKCPSGQNFDAETSSCQPPAVIIGSCGSRGNNSMTVGEKCAAGSKLIPNPRNCAQYYNCSLPVLPPRPGYLGDYVDECPYPQLYSIETRSCEPFENVTCGRRWEPKYGCEYVRNQCPVAHCRPCSVDYPNCVGKADGKQVWESRAWSNLYAICYKERSLGHGTCESGKLFSNFTNQCESIFLIPREFGGYRPSCEARADGYYPDEQNRSSYYFQCSGGEFVTFRNCPDRQIFNPKTSSCEDIHRRCGGGTDC